jgi:translation initiation factor 2 beta subunit (eIF-2beta)/eIF-5
MFMNSTYTGFIDELIKKRNFQDFTPEVREELKKDVMERLDSYLLDRMIDTFSQIDAEKFILLLKEKKSADNIENFAKEHISDYKTFITSTLADFSTNYIGINA